MAFNATFNYISFSVEETGVLGENQSYICPSIPSKQKKV
jgi:hypothetical protein